MGFLGLLFCLVLFLMSVPSGRAFYGASRSRPTLYRAKHHTQGCLDLMHLIHFEACAALTHLCPPSIPIPSPQ